MAAVNAANMGSVPSYGDDGFTKALQGAASEVFGTEQQTARDAIADASVTTHDDELVHKNLHDAFMEVAGGRSGINGFRLGCWLRANKGKLTYRRIRSQGIATLRGY